jgi:hypothetical protein
MVSGRPYNDLRPIVNLSVRFSHTQSLDTWHLWCEWDVFSENNFHNWNLDFASAICSDEGRNPMGCDGCGMGHSKDSKHVRRSESELESTNIQGMTGGDHAGNEDRADLHSPADRDDAFRLALSESKRMR